MPVRYPEARIEETTRISKVAVSLMFAILELVAETSPEQLEQTRTAAMTTYIHLKSEQQLFEGFCEEYDGKDI